MEDEVRQAFDALPKSHHWRSDARYRHPKATPDKIMAAVREPTTIVHQSNGKVTYFRIEPEEDNWFRVVLDEHGALRTAFRDDHTSLLRGRP